MQCATPINIKDKRKWTHENKILTVPCGKCGACKSNRRKSWSFRLKWEEKASKNAYFCTLTYEDTELPRTDNQKYPTLKKSDWQKFIKRLRKRNKKHNWNNLRYYGVGEYGTKTGRPHYHAIMFNTNPNIINKLDDIWIAGHCMVDHITDARIHYVTKFHINTQEQELEIEREPEFATMSKNPGIGHNYIESNGKWHRQNEYVHVINNGFKQKLPRYYREKIFSQEKLYELEARGMKESEERFDREIQRLKEKGIEKPWSYITESDYKEAKKYNSKFNNNENNKF